MSYNPANWYWNVGNKPNQVFSSASGTYVALSDSAYLAFSAIPGNFTTNILSDGELSAVLTKAELPATIIAGAGYADWGGCPKLDQYLVMLASGCRIVSSGDSSLNGTYAIDPYSQNKIQAVALYANINTKFPAGQTSLPWLDVGGGSHSFADTTEFLAFATAIGDYVTGLDLWLNGAGSLPSQPVTIA